MFKVTYTYCYGCDEVSSVLGYFDSEAKAREAFPNLDAKGTYTFSCCGWREAYNLVEFEAKTPWMNSYGAYPCTLNTVNWDIKEAIRKLADLSGALFRSSINYEQMTPGKPLPPLAGATVEEEKK
jgi:hypothetical protein